MIHLFNKYFTQIWKTNPKVMVWNELRMKKSMPTMFFNTEVTFWLLREKKRRSIQFLLGQKSKSKINVVFFISKVSFGKSVSQRQIVYQIWKRVLHHNSKFNIVCPTSVCCSILRVPALLWGVEESSPALCLIYWIVILFK